MIIMMKNQNVSPLRKSLTYYKCICEIRSKKIVIVSTSTSRKNDLMAEFF